MAVLTAGCAAPADERDSDPSAAARSSQDTGGEQCVEEAITDSEHGPAGSRDLAAWLVEDLLPPALRTAGMDSGETAILLDGEAVGEVVVEDAGLGFAATAFTYCVPAGVLSATDAAGELEGAWVLVGSDPELDVPDDAGMTLTVTNGVVQGWGVCNRYGADLGASSDGTLRISHLGATEVGCDGVEGETSFFDLLTSARRWELDASGLTVSGPDGELRFAAAAG